MARAFWGRPVPPRLAHSIRRLAEESFWFTSLLLIVLVLIVAGGGEIQVHREVLCFGVNFDENDTMLSAEGIQAFGRVLTAVLVNYPRV